MGHASARLLSAAFALLALAGCDSQFSPAYTGESLLTITGSVEIAQERREDLIIPALAFSTPEQGTVTIREVDVRGEFPSNFRLDVYQPPPRSTYFNATYQKSGEPRMAAGYVTAVSPDHEDTIRTATAQTTYAYGCEPAECGKPCGGKGCLYQRNEYCVEDDPTEPCYVENTYCPTFESPIEECTIEAVGDGDPSLKESPWRDFAGFSQNYVVVFLEKPARAGSVTAAILGSKKAVPPGYGLYSIRELTDAERQVRDACVAEAEVRAAPGFNAEFGTDLETLTFESACAPTSAGPAPSAPPPSGSAPSAPPPGAAPATPQSSGATPPVPGGALPAGEGPVEFAAPFCGGPIDEQDKVDAALDARERYVERAKLELGCQMRETVVTRVKRPARESISVIIGPEVQPALWPN